MSGGLVHYCWHCYGENTAAAGHCRHCGNAIEAPPGTSYTEQLLWALEHPLTERRMVAARVLGERGVRRAIPKLRRLALGRDDPYLAAVALRALLAISGTEAQLELLEEVAQDVAPPQVRRVARAALNRVRHEA